VARLLALLFTGCAAVLAALGFATPAHAADPPTTITIEGDGLSGTLAIRQDSQRDVFNRLLHQVGWMATRAGDPMKPDPATLGPRYTLTVLAGDKPLQRYDLYPQASGGPKALRPADQPQGKTGDAWFYVSLSVPELLHAVGVPVVDPGDTDGAGTLAYRDPAGYIPGGTTESRSLVSFSDVLHAQQRTLAVWIGTALLVLLLVVGAARVSRHYSYDRA
jgi:hypothetical protein